MMYLDITQKICSDTKPKTTVETNIRVDFSRPHALVVTCLACAGQSVLADSYRKFLLPLHGKSKPPLE